MKNSIKFGSRVAVAIVFAALCAVATFGQIKTGGYRNVSVADSDVKDAADFALEVKSDETGEELSLEAIVKAERQTVAGTNYRLCLKLYVPSKEDETDGVTLFVKTVIFRSLQNEYTVKSWEENGCGER